ncbi:hypothetical protein [Streptomyces noursei]
MQPPEVVALRQALERVEEDLGLVLGVLAALWPSSLTPVEGSPNHFRVAIDSPAGEIAFTLPRHAVQRLWHIPEVEARRSHDVDAVRLRDDRLVQLATGISPSDPVTRRVLASSVHVADRRCVRDVRGD